MQKIIFVPYKYEMEQIEIIAREIIPRLKAGAGTDRSRNAGRVP